ncbi:peroxidase, family 2 domain-containing protein [Hirsutella rhossiliensis]|uniref:Peroxidase, family 2 domain-containing protein n=1 Tax=Hirsutella rhossiliensis TaxID=111463 RepID=A0A9P8MVI0_9HYPO|nr:peroxidase, family 2 domain-containing protein [Hirsutella rhossiliensis]KAH0961929.1 peroxidase, family 2 domain-containing protein [Hirsutella rhossiliensis]
MRSQASWALAVACLAALAGADPRLNVNDARYFEFHTPDPNDSLNSLANHGFLPTNGRGVNITDIILAAFHGYGVSPETSALITIDGLVESGNSLDFVFNLEDLQRDSWRIEHDCSFSRPDTFEGAGFGFDQSAWDTVVNLISDCDKIGPLCMGRAKAARIRELRQSLNPQTVYSRAAAAHGATEVGMLLGVFSTARNTQDRLLFIRSLFENEAIPRHLGWMPREFLADVETVLTVGTTSLNADPILQQADDGQVASREDVIRAIKPDTSIPLQEMSAVLSGAGFTNPAPFNALRRISQGG